jgi:hypothetical protein
VTSQGALNSDFQQQGPLADHRWPGIAYGPAYAGRSFTWSPWQRQHAYRSYDMQRSIIAAGGAFVDTATYWDVGGTIIAKHRGLGS